MSAPARTEYLVAEVLPKGAYGPSYGEGVRFSDQLEARAYAEAMHARTGAVYEVFMVVELAGA